MSEHKIGMKVCQKLEDEFSEIIDLTMDRQEAAKIIEEACGVHKLIAALQRIVLEDPQWDHFVGETLKEFGEKS